jgi:hypothetical protein
MKYISFLVAQNYYSPVNLTDLGADPKQIATEMRIIIREFRNLEDTV